MADAHHLMADGAMVDAGVRVFADPQSAARALAREIAQALSATPNLALGLATGRTPIPLYDELARLHAQGRADFRRVTTFNLDEFLGVAPNDPRGYHAFMRRHLFDRVNLDPTRINFLNGAAVDPLAECVFRFPVGEGAPLHLLHEHGRVLATRYDDRYCYVDAVAPASLRRKLRRYALAVR